MGTDPNGGSRMPHFRRRSCGAESRYAMSFRILLVEDDARLAGMVADYLSEAGFRPTIVPSGGEAERRLRREAFDAVVLDLMLPDMDGLDLCRRIRADSTIPVLM